MSLNRRPTASPLHALLAGLGFLLLVPGTGHAAHYYGGACDPELNTLEEAINNGSFLGKRAENDRSNLLSKLEAAHGKIGLAKYSDAIDKLSDISDAATKLATAAKPKLDDATAINNATASAIYCVSQLP